MILIGRYDSPFVRRVAVALRTYGLPYEHRPWSAQGDAELLAEHGAGWRAPTLLLQDGRAVTDTWAILEILDQLAGPARAELGRLGAQRIEMFRLLGFITAAADTTLTLFCETRLRDRAWPPMVRLCAAEAEGTFDLLEAECGKRRTEWLVDDWLSHADVALGALVRFVMEAMPCENDWARWPALFEHAERCEELEAFRDTYARFNPIRPVATPIH